MYISSYLASLQRCSTKMLSWQHFPPDQLIWSASTCSLVTKPAEVRLGRGHRDRTSTPSCSRARWQRPRPWLIAGAGSTKPSAHTKSPGACPRAFYRLWVRATVGAQTAATSLVFWSSSTCSRPARSLSVILVCIGQCLGPHIEQNSACL